MEAVLEKLKQGQLFETLVRSFSESTMADTGGDLGFFRIDELSPQLQEEIQGKNAGEFTPVIDTDQGYQIFFVEEITKLPGKSFEEVSAVIEEKLYHDMVDKKFQSWLAKLRKRSHIKVVK
jgi:peptidyl-prolyl cis-trans isomerase SurA